MTARPDSPWRTPFASFAGRRFGVILADPPWRFAVRSAKGEGKSPERHYRCLDASAIDALPVQDVAARDCALFLWATWPTIETAFATIRSWGFVYKGLGFDWLKYNPATQKYAFGPGYGIRKNPEPCLLATRGAPKRLSAGIRDIIIAAPRRQHSRKPDEQYARIESLFAGPYLELFARQARPGWQSWGNQTTRFGGAG